MVDATLEIYFRRNAVLQAVWIHDAHNGKTIMNEANEKPQNGIAGFKHFRSHLHLVVLRLEACAGSATSDANSLLVFVTTVVH